MLTKLGKLEKVSKLSYADYRALVKKEVNQRMSKTTTTGVFPYVLLAGNSLQWKGDDDSTEEQPMLYLNESSQSLIQSIKNSSEFDLNGYSYGNCKMVQVGTGIQVYLSPEKGKLTQAKLLKPIKKALKKFKPKLFLEVVADLSTVEASVLEVEDTIIGDNENPENNPQIIAQKVGKSLVKYHQTFQKWDKQAKSLAKEDENRTKVLVQRSKILKHLKHLCNNWTEDVQPKAAELDLKDNWVKLYTHWTNFFKKRKEAKAGIRQDQTARAAEEERIYTKALRDLERFAEDMEKGTTVDPMIIENDIAALETHLKQWQDFAKGKPAYADELRGMEANIQQIQAEWKVEKPKMEAYHQSVQKLEIVLEGNGSEEEIMKLFKETEALANA